MNREQYLLCVLGEEASEVGQMASKNQRFGSQEIFPGQPLTNAQRTHLEIDDLMAMVEMLNEEFSFGYLPSRDRIEAKKAKVNHYGKYSESLGLVNEVANESPKSAITDIPADVMEWWPIDTAPNGNVEVFLHSESSQSTIIGRWRDYSKFNAPKWSHWAFIKPPAPKDERKEA